ncbi:MAG: hypothetical protein M1840_007057 [Geoglossum simile]|nr:MAG: hypothetical protein M1840_007057 [Geoglossum simile]
MASKEWHPRAYAPAGILFQQDLIDMKNSCPPLLSALGAREPAKLPAAQYSDAKFAVVYRECGRLLDAVELREKVLDAMKRVLGKEYPYALTSINSLEIRYSDLEGWRSKALDSKKSTLGDEHLPTLTSTTTSRSFHPVKTSAGVSEPARRRSSLPSQ